MFKALSQQVGCVDRESSIIKSASIIYGELVEPSCSQLVRSEHALDRLLPGEALNPLSVVICSFKWDMIARLDFKNNHGALISRHQQVTGQA